MTNTIIGRTNSSYWTFKLVVEETSVSVLNNTSAVSVSAYIGRGTNAGASYMWGAQISCPISVTGCADQTISYSNPNRVDIPAGAWHFIGKLNFTVPHDEDGTKTVTVSASFTNNIHPDNGSAAGDVILTAISRKAIISQSVGERTETSLAVNWSSSDPLDWMAFSLDGVNWTEFNLSGISSGSYSLSGLTIGTTYVIRSKFRKRENQLVTEINDFTASTYSLPYASKTPDFQIGSVVKIGIENPMGRTYTVVVKAAGGGTVGTIEDVSGSEVSGFADTAAMNALLDSLPSATSGRYTVSVICAGEENVTQGGTYAVPERDFAPVITGTGGRDVNPVTLAITSDASILVQKKSTVRFYAVGTAARGASIASGSVEVNGETYSLSPSGNELVGGNIALDVGSSIPAVFTVTDSRGISSTFAGEIQMKEWKEPSGIVDFKRQSNFFTATNVKVDAHYSSVSGKNSVTAKIRKKEKSSSTWSAWETIYDRTTNVIHADNTKEWEFEVVVTDRFGGTATFTGQVGIGIPVIFVDRIKRSVGILCFPEGSGTVEFDGRVLTPSIVSFSLSSNQTLNANTDVKIQLNSAVTTGAQLIAENNGVKIGAGVSAVMVSGVVLFGNPGGTKNVWIARERAGSQSTVARSVSDIAQFCSIETAPILVTVQKDDILYLYARDSAGNVASGPGNNQTYLTVETKG